MSARFFLAALISFGLLAVAADSQAADRIWAGLVCAVSKDPPEPPPKELEPFAKGLKTVFGYNTYRLVGEKRKKIRKGTEEWIIPTKKSFLLLRCTDRDASSYTVDLELYFEKRLVLKADVKLARDAPLYIRGPQWGKGQLIFILEVQ